MAINFVAPYIAADGYGQAGCNILLGLDKMGVDIYPIHVWAQYTNEDYLPKRALELCLRDFRPMPVCLYFCPPMADIGPRGGADQVVLNFTMFETTKIPDDWVPRLNRLREVWNPTQWGVDTFRECGVTVPMEVVHLGVEKSRIRYVERERDPSTFVFGWMANNSNDNRKNLDMVINAWTQLFGGTHLPVELWIKTRLGHSKAFPKDNRIVVWAGECDNELMDKIFSYVNCFVFPSRGEGWGSPPLEYMATGGPCILTNWSGMTEYIDEDICYPLRVEELTKIPRNTGDYPIGFFGQDVGSWAQPSSEHLVELMEHVYTHYTEALEKGRNAYEVVREKYHYGITCERIYGLLERVLR